MSRRAFALVELLAGLALLVLVAASVVVLARATGASASRARRQLLADRALVSIRGFLEDDLRDATDSDIALLGPTRLAMSRPVGEALPCANSGGSVVIADSAWAGTRWPAGHRDDAWLLTDVVAGSWVRVPVDSATPDWCPADGAPALRIHLAPHADTAAFVRIVEPVELSIYRSGAADWFGLAPASHAAPVQPFAGPLARGASRLTATDGLLDLVVVPARGATTTLHIPLGSRQ